MQNAGGMQSVKNEPEGHAEKIAHGCLPFCSERIRFDIIQYFQPFFVSFVSFFFQLNSFFCANFSTKSILLCELFN